MKGACDMSDKGGSNRHFMGFYDCPAVWTLRRFRDIVLKRCRPGRMFIQAYYAISPGIVVRYGHAERFAGSCRRSLDKQVAHLQEKDIENIPYVDGGK